MQRWLNFLLFADTCSGQGQIQEFSIVGGHKPFLKRKATVPDPMHSQAPCLCKNNGGMPLFLTNKGAHAGGHP